MIPLNFKTEYSGFLGQPGAALSQVGRIKLLRTLNSASEKRLKRLRRCPLGSNKSILCEKKFLEIVRNELQRQEDIMLSQEFGLS